MQVQGLLPAQQTTQQRVRAPGANEHPGYFFWGNYAGTLKD